MPTSTRSPFSFGETALLALLAVLAVATLFVQPVVCGWMVSPFVGLALLVWLWGWRRPWLRLRIRRLTREVRSAAEKHVPIQRAYWFGEPTINQVAIFVQVESDAQRDYLLGHGLRTDFERSREQVDLIKHAVRLAVESQETVDREFGGSWHGYFQ